MAAVQQFSIHSRTIDRRALYSEVNKATRTAKHYGHAASALHEAVPFPTAHMWADQRLGILGGITKAMLLAHSMKKDPTKPSTGTDREVSSVLLNTDNGPPMYVNADRATLPRPALLLTLRAPTSERDGNEMVVNVDAEYCSAPVICVYETILLRLGLVMLPLKTELVHCRSEDAVGGALWY